METNTLKQLTRLTLAAALIAGAALPAAAQIRVGINIPITGVSAMFGTSMQKALPLMPTTIAGQSVTYIVLDSGTDATKSAANTRKLVTEDKVDVLVGDSTTPGTLAMIDIAAESRTPLIAPTATISVVQPLDAKRKWVFKVVPNDDIGVATVTRYMAAHGVKKVGFIGFNDAFGQTWADMLKESLPKHGIQLVATEFFARTDTSVTAQALKLVAAKPDVVLVGAGGTPAVVPTRDLRQRGFKGVIYETHGVSSAEFIERGGKDVEGAVFAGEPFIIRGDMPADSPFRKLADDTVTRYKAANGGVEPNQFAANLVDCLELFKQVVPAALKKGKPGTPEFRAALRDELENVKDVHLNNGLLTNSPTDHAGFDPKASYMIKIENGAFRMIK
jgi:branched-chain amino acid transport system substrate-binding protein